MYVTIHIHIQIYICTTYLEIVRFFHDTVSLLVMENNGDLERNSLKYREFNNINFYG